MIHVFHNGVITGKAKLLPVRVVAEMLRKVRLHHQQRPAGALIVFQSIGVTQRIAAQELDRTDVRRHADRQQIIPGAARHLGDDPVLNRRPVVLHPRRVRLLGNSRRDFDRKPLIRRFVNGLAHRLGLGALHAENTTMQESLCAIAHDVPFDRAVLVRRNQRRLVPEAQHGVVAMLQLCVDQFLDARRGLDAKAHVIAHVDILMQGIAYKLDLRHACGQRDPHAADRHARKLILGRHGPVVHNRRFQPLVSDQSHQPDGSILIAPDFAAPPAILVLHHGIDNRSGVLDPGDLDVLRRRRSVFEPILRVAQLDMERVLPLGIVSRQSLCPNVETNCHRPILHQIVEGDVTSRLQIAATVFCVLQRLLQGHVVGIYAFIVFVRIGEGVRLGVIFGIGQKVLPFVQILQSVLVIPIPVVAGQAGN